MRIGPSLARVPLANPFVNAFAIKAPANVAVIACLLLFTLDSNVVNAPLILPCIADSKAAAAPVEDAKLNAVPASIADTLKLFLALRLGALRLGAIRPVFYNCVYKFYFSLGNVFLTFTSALLFFGFPHDPQYLKSVS